MSGRNRAAMNRSGGNGSRGGGKLCCCFMCAHACCLLKCFFALTEAVSFDATTENVANEFLRCTVVLLPVMRKHRPCDTLFFRLSWFYRCAQNVLFLLLLDVSSSLSRKHTQAHTHALSLSVASSPLHSHGRFAFCYPWGMIQVVTLRSLFSKQRTTSFTTTFSHERK